MRTSRIFMWKHCLFNSRRTVRGMRGEGEGETLGGTINLGAANGELVFSLPPTIDSLPTERSLDLFILPTTLPPNL